MVHRPQNDLVNIGVKCIAVKMSMRINHGAKLRTIEPGWSTEKTAKLSLHTLPPINWRNITSFFPLREFLMFLKPFKMLIVGARY